ncbi:MAG: SapC family protein [Alphaproteobacteria bacterium]
MADPVNPTNQGDLQVTGMPVLYRDPRPLDVANFGTRGIKSGGTASFARSNSLPVTVGEFNLVQTSYPIIFVGEPLMPVCVLGFQNNENLFLAADGSWAKDAYVPAYVRRYPFVLAEVPGDERKYLCADYSAEMITDKNPDLPFFTPDGKPTETVTKALDFCVKFQEDVLLTQSFCAELTKLGLLKPMELRFTQPDGTLQGVGTFVTIDSATLDGLSDSVFLDLRKRGLLPLIYMALLSLNNWGRLNAQLALRNVAANSA